MNNEKLLKVVFKATTWSIEEDASDWRAGTQIHISGLTKKNKSVYCRVVNFLPFVYLELPSRIAWNKTKADSLFEFITTTLCKASGPPSEFTMVKKKYLRGQKYKCMLKLFFPTCSSIRSFMKKLTDSKTGFYIDAIGIQFKPKELFIHEENVDAIIKFTAIQNIAPAGWVTAHEMILPSDKGCSRQDRKFSTVDIDIYTDYRKLVSVDMGIVPVNLKYHNFDIECNSNNPNSKLPEPEIPENVVFQIGNSFNRIGFDRSLRKKVLLTLFDPHDIPNVQIIRCKSEKDLLLRWVQLVVQEDPDIFVGYNIMKFDFDYMLKRAELLGILNKFMMCSRLIGVPARIGKCKWSSSAYGEQEFKYLSCQGRLNVDVLLEVERNYKLPNYKLSTVAQNFKLDSKDDITPRQLFMLYKVSFNFLEYARQMNSGIIKRKKRIKIKKNIQVVFPLRKCHGVVLELRKKLMSWKRGCDFLHHVREAMTITGKYCIQDVEVTENVEETLNLTESMRAMADCTGVPMSYLHTRGQQIKVLSQIYREILNLNTVITNVKIVEANKPRVKYQGATVIEANKGYYLNVACYDFESLYPSVMIVKNLCHTTIIDDESISDSECNVLEWDEHIACEHDPKKRKPKKDGSNILCGHHRYRFKKVVVLPDGTRLNEGIFPKRLRYLLSTRKSVKKLLAKTEAKLKMVKGIAKEKDLEYYTKMGWEILKPGSLSKSQIVILEVECKVLNAQQLALKVSANSMYGSHGAQDGWGPLVESAACVTAYGRSLIMEAIKFILENNKDDRLVYGDTDSAMVARLDSTVQSAFEHGDKTSVKASFHLKCFSTGIDENTHILCPDDDTAYRIDKYPRDKMNDLSDEDKILIHTYDACPVNLQFENLYWKFFLLTKKRYVAYAVNREGLVVGKIKKGCVLSRRDNCKFLRDVYQLVVDAILDGKEESCVLYIIYEAVMQMFSRQIPDTSFIIYMGVKSLINYAKKKEIAKGHTVFVTKQGREIKNVTGPDDERLVYSNIPQILLSKKMIARGDTIPPNTRLEFLYIENPDALHQGDKAEDYTFYRDNRKELHLKPDYLHYLEKQLEKPLTELITVKFPKEIIPFEILVQKIQRLISATELCVRSKIEKILKNCRKCFVKQSELWEPRSKKGVVKYKIGYSAICEECIKNKKCNKYNIVSLKRLKTSKQIHPTKQSENLEKSKPKKIIDKLNHVESNIRHKQNCDVFIYKFKGFNVVVQYIIDSCKKRVQNPLLQSEIDPIKYNELFQACLTYKSREIINIMHKQKGLRVRAIKKPTQVGPKLRVRSNDENVKVITTCKIAKYPKGTIVTLMDIREEDNPNSVNKKDQKHYFYTILMPDNVVLTDIPRNEITTFRYRDASLIKDIRVARNCFKLVIEELQSGSAYFKPGSQCCKKKDVVQEYIDNEEIDQGDS